MNILLLSMPDITLGYPTKVITPPNLAIVSLAGNLDEHHNVRTADLITRRRDVKKAVLEAMDKTKPQVVGLSAMTFQYDTARRIARFIKQSYPGVKIALGGYHATLLYEEIAASEDGQYFDFIFRGEADLSFNEAMNKLQAGEDLQDIKGLSFKAKENGKFIHNEKRELEDLAKIKLPNRSARLWGECNILKLPFDVVETSRGCRMACKFCNINSMYGKSFRPYEAQRVVADIANAKSAGTGIIFIADDNITTDTERLVALCDAIIESGHNDIIYGVQASAAGISSSEQLVKKMAQAGFKYVFLGIENASKKNLEQLRKGDIIEKSKIAVRYLKDNGIVTAGGLIIGSPDDDFQTIRETFAFARDLKLDFAGVQFLVPYPKTEMRQELIDSGLLINKDNYKLYDGGFVTARTKFLDEHDLQLIKYKMTQQYFKGRKNRSFRAVMIQKRSIIKLFKGVFGLIPDLLIAAIAGKLKKLFFSEDKLVAHHLENKLKANQFNI